MSPITCSQLQIGMVIAYKLRSDQLPKNPEREWLGKVKSIHPALEWIKVEVLDKGYEGEEEMVYVKQAIRLLSGPG
ncbi:MAG TPA: hypothetical protein VFA41_01070 [Ktedonobacteraceae bacterium]|nr:hypothetical protein [Ktedonobacteraceae bacterium]